jgi:N-methylhydantoinase B
MSVQSAAVATAPGIDSISRSVLMSALASIAEEMGAVLVRGAYSSNIKERQDCSTALFDAEGRMLAQAEHIPVHLGAMPEAVAAVLALAPRPGDVYILNDPYSGGTHLPDITLVSPIDCQDERIGFAVSRAHHSDVGGVSPGSMPVGSRSIYQEGLIVPPLRLVREGTLDVDVLELILANVRTPSLRRGDLRAQLAANGVGQRRLVELAKRRGLARLRAGFADLFAYSERATRESLAQVPDGTYTARSEIEGDGVDDVDIVLQVAATVAGDELSIDFTGSSSAVRGNVNCPLAVTRSACYFALRVLLPDYIPVNAGTYAPVTVSAPQGSVLNARAPSAVAAGNVETSQRVADTVLAALAGAAELPAHGQGTMNNLIIGGDGWTYYETIGGGQGASSVAPGASGVHVGMSNTLNTPIEALELEFPLRVTRYELRYGTGGAGRHRGGDGIERTIEVLEPAVLSLLTDRRRHRPSGAAGGGPGALGCNLLDRAELPPKVTSELHPGQRVSVMTPGGGGYGCSDGREGRDG